MFRKLKRNTANYIMGLFKKIQLKVMGTKNLDTCYTKLSLLFDSDISRSIQFNEILVG